MFVNYIFLIIQLYFYLRLHILFVGVSDFSVARDPQLVMLELRLRNVNSDRFLSA
jgi:hypothetical protein